MRTLSPRTAAALLGIVMSLSGPGCMTELGPEGRWLHYEFADGFCLAGEVLSWKVELGHCADEEEPDGTTPDLP